MAKEMTRTDFLHSFSALEQSFEDSLEQAKSLDQQFEGALQSFEGNVNHHIQKAKQVISGENDLLGTQLNAFIDTLTATNSAWREKLAAKDKGLAFRKNFSDSLLVFVYGKVKSGKSSLGNYIAWGQTDNLQEAQQSVPEALQPQYFSHDRSNVNDGDSEREAEINRSFRVGATEATSSIQGFKLPGLTWVDSPGLHSANEDNERLAKEYIDHADLILYTTTSQSPGRASDMEEIDELFNKNKKLVVLITGSDTEAEKDIILDEYGHISQVDSETVMKPAIDRQMQQDYIRQELAQLKNHNYPEIISISARYAENHPNDREAMKESGISELFEILTNISQAEGVQIKRNTPLNNFKGFIQSCEAELTPYRGLLERFKQNLNKMDQRLQNTIETHTFSAQNELQARIKADFQNLSVASHSPQMLNEAIREQQKRWNNALNEITQQTMQALFSEVMADFKAGVVASWEGANIELPNYDVEKVKKTIPTGYTKGTKRSRGGWGSLIGAGVGAIFGGAVGAAIGGTVGGTIGSMTGKSASIETREIDVVIGDNLVEIEHNALTMYTEALQNFMQQEAHKIQRNFINNGQTFIDNMAKELEVIEQRLQQLIIEVDTVIDA